MFNKHIAMSFFSIVMALTVMTGGTLAFFTDQAQSVDNTFSTGSASLLIGTDNSGAPTGLTESIPGVNYSNVSPGFSQANLFWLKNHSDGGFSMAVTVDLSGLTGTGTGPGSTDLDDLLTVGFRCDTDNNGLANGSNTVIAAKPVSQWITDGPVALATIGANQGNTNASGAFSDQDELLCEMTGTLPTGADNGVAGKSLNFDGIFDATQQ